MATKTTRDGSKSSAIRDYIAANPQAGPTEIFNALTKQGIAVSKGLVAVVKYKKPKGARRDSQPKRKAAPAKSSGSMSAADLIAARQLIDSIGGMEKTREALDLLERLQ